MATTPNLTPNAMRTILVKLGAIVKLSNRGKISHAMPEFGKVAKSRRALDPLGRWRGGWSRRQKPLFYKALWLNTLPANPLFLMAGRVRLPKEPRGGVGEVSIN